MVGQCVQGSLHEAGLEQQRQGCVKSHRQSHSMNEQGQGVAQSPRLLPDVDA